MVASSFQRTEGSLVGKGLYISKASWRLAIAVFMVDVDASGQCQCTSVCRIYFRWMSHACINIFRVSCPLFPI